MSVIAELGIPAEAFELGRILEVQPGTIVELETMVPLGQSAVPFFWVYDGESTSFADRVRSHPSVTGLQLVESHDGRNLYAMNWLPDRDLVLHGISEVGAQLLTATGTPTGWAFELRLPSHDALSALQSFCADADVPLELRRVYNPTKPDAGPWFGLTGTQRRTLLRAVEAGYYSIPRGTSTAELAEEFEVSDQAVTERLRRAIRTLVENSLLLAEDAAAPVDAHHDR